MEWWLTVFFLIGNGWVAGDKIDGWASRRYASQEECVLRKQFAEAQGSENPLDFAALWVCSPGKPAVEAPPFELNAEYKGFRGQDHAVESVVTSPRRW